MTACFSIPQYLQVDEQKRLNFLWIFLPAPISVIKARNRADAHLEVWILEQIIGNGLSSVQRLIIFVGR